ncbi:MAG: VWA domain-containing protein [Actinomycetota bacterium]|nr:VWA domain-containing protein [Actinomycetota bacterium]
MSDALVPHSPERRTPERHTPTERVAVTFARVLRGAGLRVPLGSVLAFVDALGHVGIDQRDAVYWAGRATLVRRPEDIELYDRSFAVFWLAAAGAAGHEAVAEPLHITLAIDDDYDSEGDCDGDTVVNDDPTLVLRFSAAEVLRHKDFAAYSSDELRLAQELMSQLRFIGPPRRSYRYTASRRGRRPDLPATVRASLRAGGEPIRREWRDPGERLRRLVVLLDISGSMEPYARAMLRFVHAAVSGRQKVEAFAIGTRLTRMTKELHSRDPDTALAAASQRVHDWSGGTRLGDCLKVFNDQWGVRGMARGAIVVVLSDGWDRGNPEVLAEQMQRLQRISYQTIWVNPLKVTPGYAPLARGMAAALPYVDAFVEGHSLAAMQELARVIASAPERRQSLAHAPSVIGAAR